ncbi:MAG: hypothetical protein BGO51_21960 [Rhodospirillales bacterium 69-11]|nr:MAG: hypothetical protein BGO51_21960 [Rhodospirillales bacterium 69-11]
MCINNRASTSWPITLEEPMMRLNRRLMLAGLAALPAGCASPNPALYTLDVLPGAVRSGAPAVVEVRSVAIARYLERSQIVRSSEDYRLDVLSNEWWGEPLDAMLTRVLVQELAQRLPSSTVYGDNGAVSVRPDATLAVNVQRMDQGRDGLVVLSGQIAVTGGRREAARSVRLTARPAGTSTSALVAAMSTATAALADEAAALLVKARV